MNQSLYKIEQEYLNLLSKIEELDGEITPELDEQLTITENQLKGKSIAYLSVINQKESFNDLIDAEIKRLQALKKQNDTLISKLKNRLLEAVKTFGEITTEFNRFTIRKSQRVEVDNINLLPDEFKIVKVTEQADKSALKKAIQSGEKIDGVQLTEYQNLKIN